MSIQTTTIWKLPAQPLPMPSILGAVFVTIWLFVILCAVFDLRFVLYRKPVERRTWSEFKPIFWGGVLLTTWYLTITFDRWLHYDQRAMVFGYILIQPIWEILRVLSTIILLWGTYSVIWRELESVFGKYRGHYWFAAKVFFFLVILTSLFYLVLYLALSIAWMEFLSLNSIDDIATKRTNFEISMNAFYFAFALLTFAASTATLFWGARRQEGSFRKNRHWLLLATLMLLTRAAVEFGMVIKSTGPTETRQDVQLTRDIVYGLLSALYFLFMCIMAHFLALGFDPSGKDVLLIEGNIRRQVLAMLQEKTHDGAQPTPGFPVILQDIQTNLEEYMTQGYQAQGGLADGSSMTEAHNKKAASAYLRRLAAENPDLLPREGRNNGGRSGSGWWSRMSHGRHSAGMDDIRPSAPRRVPHGPSIPE